MKLPALVGCVAGSLLCAAPVSVFAENLLAIYDIALINDPQIREADAQRLATRESRPQAIANLLPNISGSYNRGRDETSGTGSRTQVLGGNPTLFDTGGRSTVDSNGWSLNLRQSVFDWSFWAQLKQSGHQVAQAEADYVVQQQGLIQRVASAYFAVLGAQDDVLAIEAARDAIARQLDQAEKRFEVGLIAITDVQQARAARDSAAADTLEAKRALASAWEQLRTITGQKFQVLNQPGDSMPLLTPEPANEDEWVKVAMDQNASLLSSRLAADIARDQVNIQFGGHLPSIDVVASRSFSDSDGENVFSSGQLGSSASRSYGNSVQLQLTVPLFSGGLTQSRVRQSQYLWIASKERLERTSRDTERLARDAYLGVVSEISRVQALRQAVESNQTALRATEAGYDVGTRTAVDVLDARRLLVQAQSQYSRSKYSYLNNLVQLRLASGDLDRGTIEEIIKWLTVVAPPPAPNPAPPAP